MNQPQKRDCVWVEARHKEGMAPNGVILRIDEDCMDGEVLVGFTDGFLCRYDLLDFAYKWTDKFGGLWYLSVDGSMPINKERIP